MYRSLRLLSRQDFLIFTVEKKSLIISISFSVLSLVLVFLYTKKILFSFYTLGVILLMKGLCGNTVPISWAAIADTQKRDFRFSLTLSLWLML